MFNLPNELIYTGCFKKVLNGLRRLTTILIQTTWGQLRNPNKISACLAKF